MNKIILGDKTYQAPSLWNELAANQLCTWMKICAKDIDEESSLKLATVVLYGLPEAEFLKLNRPQKIQLIYTLVFLMDPSPSLTDWIIPEIKPSFSWALYGPSNRLSSSTIEEFRATEMLYNAFKGTQEPELLNRLIAALYRRKAKKGATNDIRERLTELGITARSKKINSLPKELKSAILFNYEGCRNYIFKKYPTIFQSGKQEQKTSLPDLQGMIRNIAGGKFGNYVETEKTNLYLFLDHLKDSLADTKN